MGRIIAIANQKGGVGKTTTAVNLTAALANLGKNVLLIDCDPQGNATSGMGVRKTTRPNIYDILINGVPAENCVVRTKHGYVIPSNKELSGATVELVEREQREYILREALQDLQTVFDIILLDPPYAEVFLENSLKMITEIDILQSGGIIVTERPFGKELPWDFPGFSRSRDYKYGNTLVTIYRKL